MYIVPRKNYKRIISSVLASLLLLTLILVITTAVMGTRPVLGVKQGLGTYNAKDKVFTPNFDDLDVKRIYERVDNKGDKVGLYYRDIFTNNSSALSKYEFPKDGFLPLERDEKDTYITLKRKQKRTFNKKGKDLTVRVDWKNLLFVRDQESNNLAAVKKTSLIKRTDFNLLEDARKYRIERATGAPYTGKGPLSEYDLATAQVSEKELVPLFSNSGFSTKLQDPNEKDNRDAIINKATHIRIFNPKQSAGATAKKGIYTFSVEDDVKKLEYFEEITNGGTVRLPDGLRGKGYTWYKSSLNLDASEIKDRATTILDETREDTNITYSTYYYAIKPTDNPVRNVTVVHEFEDSKSPTGYSEKSFGKLYNPTRKKRFKGKEPISVANYSAYDESVENEFKMEDNAVNLKDWNDYKRGYNSLPKVYYKYGSQPETEIPDKRLPYLGEEDYTVIYRYEKKTFKLHFYYEKQDGGRTEIASDADIAALGISKTEFKFEEEFTLDPYHFNDGRVFEDWKVVRNVNGTEKGTVEQGKTVFTLTHDLIGDDSIIRFVAQGRTDSPQTQKQVILKYYVEELADADGYKLLTTKRILRDGNNAGFTKDQQISGFENLVTGSENKPSSIDKTYDGIPELIDERNPDKTISVSDNIIFDQNDFMKFGIRYKRSRDTIKFNNGDGVYTPLLSDTEFDKLFNKEHKVKFGATVSRDVIAKNLIDDNGVSPKYVFKSSSDALIGTSTILGWKPVDAEYNNLEYCDENGFFKLQSYKNEHKNHEKKTIQLYPVWAQEYDVDVNAYLADEDADNTINSLKYKYTYNFKYKVKMDVGSTFNFSDSALKAKIKSEIGEKLTDGTLKLNHENVFDYNAIDRDIEGQTNLQISKTQVNTFNVYIKRFTSELTFDLNFNYNGDRDEDNVDPAKTKVAENVAELKKNSKVNKTEFEELGLWKNEFNIPEQQISVHANEVSDRGKHKINLKEQIANLGLPEYLLGSNSVYEAYYYDTKDANNSGIEGQVKGLKDEVIEVNRGSRIRVDFRPKQYNIGYEFESNQHEPNPMPTTVRYLHKTKIGVPTTNKQGDIFAGWQYEDGRQISDALIKYVMKMVNNEERIDYAEYIMPASNVKLRPIFTKEENVKVYVNIRTQKVDGEYETHSFNDSEIHGKYEESSSLTTTDWYFKKGETIQDKKPDLTKYTTTEYLKKALGTDYKSSYLDSNLVGAVADVGTIDKIHSGTEDKYILSIARNAKTNGGKITITVTFNRYKVRVDFKTRSEHSDANTYTVTGMPSSVDVFVGGKLPSGIYNPTMSVANKDGESYNAPFRGWSRDDESLGADTKRDATDWTFNEDSYKQPGSHATLYARWFAIKNVRIYAQVRFQRVDMTYEKLGAVPELTISRRVTIPFDGDSTDATTLMPRELFGEVVESLDADTMKPYKATETDIMYDGTDPTGNTAVNMSYINKNMLNYKIDRKSIVVRYEMPDGSTILTKEETVLYGGKVQEAPTGAKYNQPAWGDNTFADLKHFSVQRPNYTNDYSEDKPKLDITTYVFGEADFVSGTKVLYPVWDKASRVQIKLKIYGQDTTGDGYNQDKSEHLSNLNKSDGDKITVNDVLEFVKGKIDQNVYNRDNMIFKHKGAEIDLTDNIDVKLPNTVIEFYVKRNIRTITLHTDRTVSVTNVKGGEVSNNNKTIKFRHGYSYVGDEAPTLQYDTQNEIFLGWFNGSDKYEFKNNTVTSDLALEGKVVGMYAIVNINLNGMRGDNLRYEDGSITGAADAEYTKVTIKVPYASLATQPYALKNLKADGYLYKESSQKAVTQTGYKGQTTINETGKTYEVTVQYQEDETLYKGMYPQTKAPSDETEGAQIYARALVATFSEPSKYGEVACTFAYRKGVKYEVISGNYYRFEDVETELFPACEDGQMWTKNTIDVSIFHEYKDNSNIYNNSYIKEYLEKVVKVKMQVASIGLPMLKNRTIEVMDEGTAKTYSNTQSKRDKLKWKKITDYTKEVHASYKTLRNINNMTISEHATYPQYTWLGTRYSGYTDKTYDIYPSGVVDWSNTNNAFGLRPVITK